MAVEELVSPLKLMLTFLPVEAEGTRQMIDVEDTNVRLAGTELESDRMMRQAVFNASKIAEEWVMLTFTAPNRENAGFKMKPPTGIAGEGVADGVGDDVTGGTEVPEETADVAPGEPVPSSIPN